MLITSDQALLRQVNRMAFVRMLTQQTVPGVAPRRQRAVNE
jgi:hypothetical protein